MSSALEDENSQELDSLFSVLEERFTELTTKDGEFVAIWLEDSDIKEEELCSVRSRTKLIVTQLSLPE